MKFSTSIIISIILIQIFGFFPREATATERLISANLESLYNARKFEELITYGNSLLEAPETLYPDELAQLHRYMGFTYVILRREYEAKRHFIEWLKMEPDASLDPVMIPPNIVRIFYLAKDIAAGESSKPAVFVPGPGDRWLQVKPILWRSMLIPGWGHYHAGYKTKGVVMMLIDAGLIGGFIISHAEYLKARDNYFAETDVEKMNMAYDNYNNANRWQIGFAAAYIVSYAAIQYDIFNLTGKESTALSIDLLPSPNYIPQVQTVTVSFLTVTF